MPRYAADRTLDAPVEDVWEVLANPHRLPDWWPGLVRVDPGRRGLVPGGLWHVEGPNRPHYLRRPELTGTLLVLDVVPLQRVSFQLTGDRLDAELELEPEDDARTRVTLLVEVPWLIGVGRRFPHQALDRLERAVERRPPGLLP